MRKVCAQNKLLNSAQEGGNSSVKNCVANLQLFHIAKITLLKNKAILLLYILKCLSFSFLLLAFPLYAVGLGNALICWSVSIFWTGCLRYIKICFVASNA